MEQIESILNSGIIDINLFAKIDLDEKWNYVKLFYTNHGYCNLSFEYNDKTVQTYIKFLEILSECGSDKSMYELGYMYYYGINVEKNYEKAFKYYKMSANKRNGIAIFSVGYMYEIGLGTEQNYDKAIEYYNVSLKLGNSDAMYNLGCVYQNNDYVGKDYSCTLKYFNMAVKRNHCMAMYNLAIMYLYGIGVEQSHSEFVKYFNMAIEHSHGNYTKEMMMQHENEALAKSKNCEPSSISLFQKIKKYFQYINVSHTTDEICAINE